MVPNRNPSGLILPWYKETHNTVTYNILLTRIPFIPCQSALPFLRYSIFKCLSLAEPIYKKAITERQHPSAPRSVNGQVWPKCCLIWQLFGPWASPYGENGQITMTLHNYRSRQFHRTSNRENPWSGYRDMDSAHDDVIKWKHFPHYWPFAWGIHRSPVNSLHKGQWRRALMFSLICIWINGCKGSKQLWGWWFQMLSHYDVIVMKSASRPLGHPPALPGLWRKYPSSREAWGVKSPSLPLR